MALCDGHAGVIIQSYNKFLIKTRRPSLKYVFFLVWGRVHRKQASYIIIYNDSFNDKKTKI